MTPSFLQRLIDTCEARPDKIAMRVVGDGSQVYSYGEMLGQIRSVAYRLSEEGIEFGDRVALIGENHPCWAVAYLAILYRGAVCVPLDPHGEIETITNFLENAEARLAFIGPEMREKFDRIDERLKHRIRAVEWDSAVAPAYRQQDTGAVFADWAATEFPDSFASDIPKAAGDAGITCRRARKPRRSPSWRSRTPAERPTT